ncbi:MAG TPA: 16S rRNA (guanine(527)-N(7))-methyltransferase RsmG [bacterium]|nr:16S rRNA (guanine(527)-N(7))-methyltransferase RsmG [bacterium]
MTDPGLVLIAPELEARGIELDALQRERLVRYAALLQHWNRRINLVGTQDSAELWQRHVLDCLMLASVPPNPALRRWLDVGSGAGLPGIVLAILRPDVDVTAAETVAKKATFLQEAARQLDLPNFHCLRQDVHRLAGRPDFVPFDALVARAFGPLGGLLALGVALLRPAGEVWAMKGRRWAAEAAQILPAVLAAYEPTPGVHPYCLEDQPEGFLLVYRRLTAA